jgi:tetratricopeptide (TPR) repeat protein
MTLRLVLPLLLTLLAAAVYAPTLGYGRVIDDDVLLRLELSPRELLFEPELIEGSPYYRPVTVATYVTLQVFKEGAPRTRAAHAESVVLYAVSCAAVFWLCAALLDERPFALAGASIATLAFALHPIHTETAAWITARPDMIVGLLVIGAIAALRRYEATSRWPWIALATALVFLSPLAKEVGASAFVLVPAYVLMCGAQPATAVVPASSRLYGSIRRMIPALITSAVAALAYVALRLAALDGPGESGLAWRMLEPRPLFGALGFYAEKLFAPQDLLAYYAVVPVGTRFVAAGVVALVVWTAATIAALRWNRQAVAFGLIWSAVTLAISLPFFVAEPSIAPIAERYLYLPSIGMAVVMAWVIAEVLARLPSVSMSRSDEFTPGVALAWATAAVAVAALSITFSVMTLVRLPDWKDLRTFWETTSRDNPTAGFPHAALASTYVDEGRIEEAESELKQAVVGEIDDGRRAIAWNDLGALYAGRLNDFDRAVGAFDAGIALAPEFGPLRLNLAYALWQQANMSDPKDQALLRHADEQAALFIELLGEQPGALILQGQIAGDLGDAAAARRAYGRVRDLYPNTTWSEQAGQLILLLPPD